MRPRIEVNQAHEGGRIEQADEVRQHPIGSDPQSFRFNERG